MDIVLKVGQSPKVEVLVHLDEGGCEQVSLSFPHRLLSPRPPPT